MLSVDLELYHHFPDEVAVVGCCVIWPIKGNPETNLGWRRWPGPPAMPDLPLQNTSFHLRASENPALRLVTKGNLGILHCRTVLMELFGQEFKPQRPPADRKGMIPGFWSPLAQACHRR